jgi:hypothetical protein
MSVAGFPAGRVRSGGSDLLSAAQPVPAQRALPRGPKADRLFGFAVFLILGGASLSHGATVPEASTSAATDISCTSARLRGSIVDWGGEPCQYRFHYWDAGQTDETTDWTGSEQQSSLFSTVVSGLRPGTTYSFAVQARNSAGPGPWGNQRSFVTVGLPTASTATATNITCDSATLRGTVVSDGGQACEYRFCYREANDESYLATAWAGSVRREEAFSETITGLRAGTTYYFRAQVQNCAGPGDSTGERSFTTAGLPAISVSAASDITCNSARLRASVSADGGQACEYRFRYGQADTYTVTAWTGPVRTGQLPSEIVSGLSAATTYNFSAQIKNCAGESAWAGERSFTTSACGVVLPTASTQSAAGVSPAGATLQGRLDNDGGAPCSYQFRYRRSSGGDSFTSWAGSVVTGQSFSAMVDSLEAGVTYYFAVRARNSAGAGGWGSELSFLTPLLVKTPQVITLPAADVGTTSATLGGRLEDDGGAPCAHRLRYKKAGGSYRYTEWVGSATTGHVFGEIVRDLEMGTTYHFAGQARNSAGEGGWGSELSFATAALIGTPQVTTAPAVDISTTSATLGGSVGNDGGAPCAYRFRYRKAGASYSYTTWAGSVTTGQSFSEVLSTLVAGATYYFAAQAKNSAGEGPWGGDLSFATPSLARTPQAATGLAGAVSASSATLSGAVADDGGAPCAYRFRYRKSDGAYRYTSWTGSMTTGQSFSDVIDGLEAGATYYFAAQTRNAAGESGWATELSFVTASSGGVPRVTTMPVSDVGATSAVLLGCLDDDGGTACESRFRYYPQDSGSATAVETGWESCAGTDRVFACTIQGLRPGAEYIFVAQARNAAGTACGAELAFTTTQASDARRPDVIHVDDDAALDPGPGDLTVSDPREDGTEQHPFDSIQEAIEAAPQGARVLVHEGVYRENVDLTGRRLSVEGLWLTDANVFGVPVIEGTGGGPVVRFAGGEDPDCQLMGLALCAGSGAAAPAVECRGAGPLIAHCIVAGNRTGARDGAILVFADSRAVVANCTVCENVVGGEGAVLWCENSAGLRVTNSIFWGNAAPLVRVEAGAAPQVTYCDTQEPVAGIGNLQVDPLFAGAGYRQDGGPAGWADDGPWVMGDYHLRSRQGRFWARYGIWAFDSLDSPCLDAGDPDTPWSGEPAPHGKRVNLGAFGGTWQASRSRW